MKTFKFKIREVVEYEQTSTVMVQAKSLEEAKLLVLMGDYESVGDNVIDLSTEDIISIKIEEHVDEKV